MPPVISWLAHLSCHSSRLTVSGCPGALLYPCDLLPAATSSPLWFVKSRCLPPHRSPPAAAPPPLLIPPWPAGSEPDPEPSCFLGLGSPSICWNLWAVSHESAELNLCLSQEDLGHMHVLCQIFFSENGCLGGSWWTDGHRSCFFVTLTAQSRRHTTKPFTTRQLFGCIHIKSQSRVSNGPRALFLLVKFLWSVVVSYIHLKTL